jgi:hypothetical protein
LVWRRMEKPRKEVWNSEAALVVITEDEVLSSGQRR